MSFQIEEKILNWTICVKNDFRCLNEEMDSVCEIEYEVDNKIFFIKKNGKADYCTYRKHFGDRYYCTCPTRIAIYQKYGK